MRRFLAVTLLLVFLGGCAKTTADYEPSSLYTEVSVSSTAQQTFATTETPSVPVTEERTTKETSAVTATESRVTEAPSTTGKPDTTTETKPSTTAKTTSAPPVVNEDYMAIIGMRSVIFGSAKQAVIDVLGQPTECITEKSSSGDVFESMVYAFDYSELTVVQFKNDFLGGFYTVARRTIITDGESTYSLRSGGLDSFGKMKITVFNDEIEGGAYALWAKYDGFSYVPEAFSDTAGQEKLMFYLTNGLRAINGLPALEHSEKATVSARLHSEDMVENNYFNHQSPDGRRAADRMTAQGISYRTCGENIASGYKSPFHFVDGWYNSSGHRSNILYENFVYLGIGVVSKGGASLYATQNFYG